MLYSGIYVFLFHSISNKQQQKQFNIELGKNSSKFTHNPSHPFISFTQVVNGRFVGTTHTHLGNIFQY